MVHGVLLSVDHAVHVCLCKKVKIAQRYCTMTPNSTPHNDVSLRHSSRNFIACTEPVTIMLYLAIVAFHTAIY